MPAKKKTEAEPKAEPKTAEGVPSGVVGDVPSHDPDAKPEFQAKTVVEAAKDQTDAEGEHYQQGYEGYAPSRDEGEPEDLTLSGVIARSNEKD